MVYVFILFSIFIKYSIFTSNNNLLFTISIQILAHPYLSHFVPSVPGLLSDIVEQGSQTQIHKGATFGGKKSLRAAF
jgi:hypothetical protein